MDTWIFPFFMFSRCVPRVYIFIINRREDTWHIFAFIHSVWVSQLVTCSQIRLSLPLYNSLMIYLPHKIGRKRVETLISSLSISLHVIKAELLSTTSNSLVSYMSFKPLKNSYIYIYPHLLVGEKIIDADDMMHGIIYKLKFQNSLWNYD